MSYLEYRVATVPSGFAKILHMNWAIVFLVTAIAVVSCVMLYSVGGSFSKWADPQLKRFGVTFLMMFIMANSACNETSEVMVPAPAIKGNAMGTMEAVLGLSSL